MDGWGFLAKFCSFFRITRAKIERGAWVYTVEYPRRFQPSGKKYEDAYNFGARCLHVPVFSDGEGMGCYRNSRSFLPDDMASLDRSCS